MHWWGWFPVWSLSCICRWQSSPCVCPLGLSVPYSLLTRLAVILDWSIFYWPHFNLITSLKILSPITVIFRVTGIPKSYCDGGDEGVISACKGWHSPRWCLHGQANSTPGVTGACCDLDSLSISVKGESCQREFVAFHVRSGNIPEMSSVSCVFSVMKEGRRGKKIGNTNAANYCYKIFRSMSLNPIWRFYLHGEEFDLCININLFIFFLI